MSWKDWFFGKPKKQVRKNEIRRATRGSTTTRPVVPIDDTSSLMNPMNPVSPMWIGHSGYVSGPSHDCGSSHDSGGSFDGSGGCDSGGGGGGGGE